MHVTSALLGTAATIISSVHAQVDEALTKIPLPHHGPVKDEAGYVDLDHFFAEREHVISKYTGVPPKWPSPQHDRSKAMQKRQYKVPLTSENDGTLYAGNAIIGDQKFVCTFDTGSNLTFIPGHDCSEYDCPGDVRYNATGKWLDDDYHFHLPDDNTVLDGTAYQENVTVSGLTAANMTVIAVSKANGWWFQHGANCQIGMKYAKSAKKAPPRSFFGTLDKQDKVKHAVFSFYFAREDSGYSSEMVLGGNDTSKQAWDYRTMPVLPGRGWRVPLQSYSIRNSSQTVNIQNLGTANASMDTGTSMILAPQYIISGIAARIPGGLTLRIPKQNHYGNTAFRSIYTYDCNADFKITLELGDRGFFAVDPVDFNYGELHPDVADSYDIPPNQCMSALQSADAFFTNGYSGDLILGTSFLKNWYSIFSWKGEKGLKGGPSISLALAKH